jgi:hypothetical protein
MQCRRTILIWRRSSHVNGLTTSRRVGKVGDHARCRDLLGPRGAIASRTHRDRADRRNLRQIDAPAGGAASASCSAVKAVIGFGGRIGRVKGRGSGSCNVVEPAPVHRDTNDTKSMARDIGTIQKGRTVIRLS